MITKHPVWEKLKIYTWKEEVPNQARKKGPRYRRNIMSTCPKEILEEAKVSRVPCVVCGDMVCPVRKSDGYGYYISTCCPQSVKLKCSKSRKILSEAVLELEADIEATKEIDHRQQELFQM